MSNAWTHEPKPIPGKEVVWQYIWKDIEKRVEMGIEKHGGPLMTHNGRDALMDAYQEGIDIIFYLKQAIMERDGVK